MKKYIRKFMGFFRPSRDPGYSYPVDEKQYEENPLKVRTSEMSQFQDEVRDIETRTPEREVFDNSKFEDSKEKFH